MKSSASTLLKLIAALAACCALSACSSDRSTPVDEYASAPVEEVQVSEDASFDVASVSDSTLSEQRGGFLFMGGVKIDFGFISTTRITDTITGLSDSTSITLSTAGLNGVLPTSLQQLVQTGGANNVNVAASNSVPINVLTVVQNTVNNALIQNQNQLDITVSNLAAMRNQQIILNSRFAGGLVR